MADEKLNKLMKDGWSYRNNSGGGGVIEPLSVTDTGMMIERDGVRYSEAIDPLEFGRIYVETDEPIKDVLSYDDSVKDVE